MDGSTKRVLPRRFHQPDPRRGQAGVWQRAVDQAVVVHRNLAGLELERHQVVVVELVVVDLLGQHVLRAGDRVVLDRVLALVEVCARNGSALATEAVGTHTAKALP